MCSSIGNLAAAAAPLADPAAGPVEPGATAVPSLPARTDPVRQINQFREADPVRHVAHRTSAGEVYVSCHATCLVHCGANSHS
jgi:hypothetical protein